MSKMDWDRVGREKRIQMHGSAGINEEDTIGNEPLGSTRDEPYWPGLSGGRPGDLYRSRTARSNGIGENPDPALVIFFNLFVSQSEDDAILEQCSDQELRECRDTCQSLLNSLSGLTWSPDQKQSSAASMVTRSVGGQEATKVPVLIIALRTINLFSKHEEHLNACSNLEIQRFRKICQETRERVVLKILQRETVSRPASQPAL